MKALGSRKIFFLKYIVFEQFRLPSPMFFELKNSDVNELFKSRKGHSPPRSFVPMSNWWVWTNFEPNLGCVPGIKCKFYPPHDTIEKEIFENKEYFIFPWVFHHWVRGFFKFFPYPLWTIISKRNVSVGENIFLHAQDKKYPPFLADNLCTAPGTFKLLFCNAG